MGLGGQPHRSSDCRPPPPQSSSVLWAGPRLWVARKGGWRLQTTWHTVGLQARGRLSAEC